MLWHLEIHPAPGYPDLVGKRLSVEAAESGIPGPWTIAASRGFLVEGTLRQEDIDRAARQVLADPVVESFQIRPVPSPAVADRSVVHVLPRPGVTDPEAESALRCCASSASPWRECEPSAATGSTGRPNNCRA